MTPPKDIRETPSPAPPKTAPVELLDIIGQEDAIQRLQRGLSGQRMPHAYLFAGPEGVGRETTAVAMARTMLCAKPVGKPNDGRFPDLPKAAKLLQACGQCDDCRMTASLSHPDLHLIYKELARYHDDPDVRSRVMQELSIDVIRSFLIAPAGRGPSRGRGKVFIVREAELMSAAAQNALLKTLEEPPPGVTIILLCERPEELLPTTRSRCATLTFRLLPVEFVTRKLLAAGVAKEEAEFWSAFTAGALGRALRLAAQGLYERKRELLELAASPQAAGELGEFLHKTTESLADATVKAVKAAEGAEMSKVLAGRQAAGTLLELLAAAFRDALHRRTQAAGTLVNGDQIACIQTLAERFDAVRLADILEQLSEYERLLWRNVNAKVIWDNVAITCATGAPLVL